MEICSPYLQKGYQQALENTPRHFQKLMIPIARKSYFEWEEGMLLLQSLPLIPPSLNYYHFKIKKAVGLSTIPLQRKRTLLLYIKSGNPEGFHTSLGSKSLQQGLYYLFCVPAAKGSSISLQPGRYKIVQMNVRHEELLKMPLSPQQERALKRFLDAPEKKATACLKLPSDPISRL